MRTFHLANMCTCKITIDIGLSPARERSAPTASVCQQALCYCRYVTHKDLRRNAVYITRSYYEEDRIRNAFQCGNFNWTAGNQPELSSPDLQLTCKIRHGPILYPCSLALNDDGTAADVRLEGNDQGLAPGQSAVFYQDNLCIGAATILASTAHSARRHQQQRQQLAANPSSQQQA